VIQQIIALIKKRHVRTPVKEVKIKIFDKKQQLFGYEIKHSIFHYFSIQIFYINFF